MRLHSNSPQLLPPLRRSAGSNSKQIPVALGLQ